MASELVFQRVGPELETEIARFYQRLVDARRDRTFHPHPFDAVEAHRRAVYDGLDEYHVALHDGTIVAYGMLRGWDEGYDVPSLGLAVDDAWQRRGIGRRMLVYLHDIARARKASRVRLRVDRDNKAARRLYESIGYEFTEESPEVLVGVLAL
jgi:[ribosomal protein S18]-alanine N-acetyltransferase